jgi:hypothetical protein
MSRRTVIEVAVALAVLVASWIWFGGLHVARFSACFSPGSCGGGFWPTTRLGKGQGKGIAGSQALARAWHDPDGVSDRRHVAPPGRARG